jgi:hypothetical protein
VITLLLGLAVKVYASLNCRLQFLRWGFLNKLRTFFCIFIGGLMDLGLAVSYEQNRVLLRETERENGIG